MSSLSQTLPTRSTAPPLTEETIKLRVLREQVSALYGMTVSSVAADISISLIMSITFYLVLGNTLALIWLAIHFAQLVCTAYFVLPFYKEAKTSKRSEYWLKVKIVALAIHSISWGLAPILFLPVDNSALAMFMMIIILSMCSGGVSAVASQKGTIISFCAPMIAGLVTALIWHGGMIYLALAAGSVVFLLANLKFAFALNKILTNALVMQFEKETMSEMLAEQVSVAERASRDKTRFLASASHDLRQPVHALTLFVDALHPEITSNKGKSLLGNIDRSIKALNQLLGSLLDISKLDANIVKPHTEHFVMQYLCDMLYSEFVLQAQEKGIELKFHMGINIIVKSDPILLGNMMRNLISNALRYTKAGSIEINCSQQGDEIRIEISDTGIGIPQDQHKNIFREFFQISNPERDRTKGLGLGLAIVERLAGLMQHRLELHSEVGKGSRFVIVLSAGDPVLVASQDLQHSKSGIFDIVGMRIIVIDDEQAVRDGMQAVLENWGCVTILAGSEEEALEKLNDGNSPQLIIVDYRLRDGKNGAEAIENIQRKIGKKIPALIITGDTGPNRLREAEASGYTLMHKPVQPAKLRTYLRHVQRRKT